MHNGLDRFRMECLPVNTRVPFVTIQRYQSTTHSKKHENANVSSPLHKYTS